MPVLDCDIHFTDHEAHIWDIASVPPAERPRLVEGADGSRRLAIGDLVFPRPTGPGCGNPSGVGHLVSAGGREDRRRAVEANEVNAAVLQPGFVGLSIHAVADPDVRRALYDRYNELVAEEAGADDAAYWVLLTGLEDLGRAGPIIEGCSEDANLVGIVTRPTGRLADARWSDEGLLPVLAVLAERGLTLFLHGGTGCHQWSPLADRFDSYAMTHAFGHMGEHMVALGELLCLVEELPVGLRVVLLESGTSWLPPVLDRLESHRHRLGGSVATVWDTFREHFAVVPDVSEADIERACLRIGTDNVLFGSDYPHWDCVEASGFFDRLRPTVTRDSVRRATERFIPRFSATQGGCA